jgi:hypothetical protein
MKINSERAKQLEAFPRGSRSGNAATRKLIWVESASKASSPG